MQLPTKKQMRQRQLGSAEVTSNKMLTPAGGEGVCERESRVRKESDKNKNLEIGVWESLGNPDLPSIS